MKTSIISEWKLWRLETITMPLKHSLLRLNVVLRKKSHRYSLRETQKKLIASTQEKVLIEIEKERVEKLPNLLPSQGVLKFNIIFSALMIVAATV